MRSVSGQLAVELVKAAADLVKNGADPEKIGEAAEYALQHGSTDDSILQALRNAALEIADR